MATSIGDIPPQDRPRERLGSRGVDALTDAELLALVLRSGTRVQGVVDLAGALLAEYRDLAALAAARPEELAAKCGVGEAKAASLVAAFELGRRMTAVVEPTVLRSAEDVARIARQELAGARRERVLVLVCDAANRLRRTVVVSEGALDRTLMPVREILNAVLRHDGRAFAVAHNHPSGELEPSEADRAATRDVRTGARAVGLRFLGHVVVGDGAWQPVA